MAKLTSPARNALSAKTFAGPDRSYPIPDPSHARNALSRVSQFGSPALKATVRAKVHKKFPAIGGDNRAGRLSTAKTDRGAFRFKANRRGE